MLSLKPTLHLLAAVRSPPSAHGIPAAVWLILALNVAVVGFFAYRIVGLLRARDGETTAGGKTDTARDENPSP